MTATPVTAASFGFCTVIVPETTALRAVEPRLRDRDRPVDAPAPARREGELRLVDGLLDVPGVDLLPGRLRRLRDDEVLDADVVLRVETEVDVADAVGTRRPAVRVDRRREPRVRIVRPGTPGVVVVDHRVVAALHHDGRHVVVPVRVDQLPAQRAPVDVERGDPDDRATARVLAARRELADVDPERCTPVGRAAQRRIVIDELVAVGRALIGRPVVPAGRSRDGKCHHERRNQPRRERPPLERSHAFPLPQCISRERTPQMPPHPALRNGLYGSKGG